MGNLLARAGTAGKPVDLGVLRTNGRARALYERLGFRAVHGDGIKIHMRWAAGRRA